jgi:hypothetical protein
MAILDIKDQKEVHIKIQTEAIKMQTEAIKMQTEAIKMQTEAIIIPNLSSRIIGQQALLLDSQSDEIRLLNDVGSLIWSKIMEKSYTSSHLLNAVLDHFEIEAEIAQNDLMAFLNLLESKNMIKRVENTTENLMDSSVAFELQKGKS